jgi:hypothetical protein
MALRLQVEVLDEDDGSLFAQLATEVRLYRKCERRFYSWFGNTLGGEF